MKTERARGFTLIEVLVALLIVGLGLMAVFGQINQSVTTAIWLRDKTLAHWVAVNYLTEQRIAGEYPAEGKRTAERELAGITWRISAEVAESRLEGLREIEIAVATTDRPDEVITTLFGALRQPLGELRPGDEEWVIIGDGGSIPDEIQ